MGEMFEFSPHPPYQIPIDVTPNLTQGTGVETTIVVEPTSQHRIHHSGKILQGFVIPKLEMPAPDLPIDFLAGKLTDGREKVGMNVAASVYTPTGAKRKAEKVKTDPDPKKWTQS
jgi:hypothetical protein